MSMIDGLTLVAELHRRLERIARIRAHVEATWLPADRKQRLRRSEIHADVAEALGEGFSGPRVCREIDEIVKICFPNAKAVLWRNVRMWKGIVRREAKQEEA